jgi:peptide/nickel transport system substrate-binding protein
MAHESGKPDLDRRKLLKYIGAGSAAGLAGCSGGGGGDGTGTTGGGGGTTTQGNVPDADATIEQEGTDVQNRTVGGTFISASTSTASGMNLLQTDDTTTVLRLLKMYDTGGGALGPKKFEPRWMESWELSDDSQKVTYKLRDGLQWGAGHGQLTAEDYMYFLNELALLSGDDDWYGFTDTQFYQLGAENETISFNKTGKLSFTAELPIPKPQWLHEDPLPGQFIVPKSLLKKYVPNQDKEGLDKDKDMIEGGLSQGNLGPYQFEQWERSSKWVFSRNEDYYMQDVGPRDDTYDDYRNFYQWDESPYFENYQYQVFDENSTALSALKTGEVQTAGINSRKVSNYKGMNGINVWQNSFGNGVFWLNMNHRINGWGPIRNSRKVRQAFGNLYDKQTIIKQINNGNAVPLSTFHPKWGPFYPPEDDLYEPEGKIEEAKTLLEEGTSNDYGYDSKGVFKNGEGNQVSLKAVRTTGNPATELGAQYMKSRLDKAGIKLNINAAQWSTLLSSYAMNSAKNVDGVDEPDWSTSAFNGGPWNQSASSEDWSLMFGLGFSTSPYAPWSAVKSTMAEKQGFNLWGYHQDKFDIAQTIDDASTASDPEVTQEKMTELFGFLSRDMPVVWTQSDMVFQGVRDNVIGFPGQKTDWGYEATSYFGGLESARLMGFQKQ